jgi:hypothetical protein
MSHNIFLKDPDEYIRDLNIVDNAVELSALYLHQITGKLFEDCKAFVEQEISYGKNKLSIRKLKLLKRNEFGDRKKVLMPINTFLKGVEQTKSILTPNGVVYDSSDVNLSCTAKYIENNLTLRNKVKKEGLLAYQQGDMKTFSLCNNLEYIIKVYNNSMSGAHASPHNPLYNKTAHSSLSSNCRIMVSYSNASTERFITGNRHYWSVDVVIENILSVIANTDYEALSLVVNKYNIYIPSCDEIVEMITRSTGFYWSSYIPSHDIKIKELVLTLNELQRVAFLYTGDFYHLAQYNEILIKDFITKAVSRPTVDSLVENPEEIIKLASPGIIPLVGILCSDFLAGITVNELKLKSPDNYIIYINTILQVESVIYDYRDLITVFFLTNTVPPSIYNFLTSIRRSVVGSDTDSTMFTVQDFIIWYFGKLTFGFEADKVANFICYLNTQVVSHLLATAAKQMGVSNKNLFRLEMKNEFGFPVYMRANRSKHYATLLSSREGNVYKKPKIEIKGVALKDSKVPREIMRGLEKELNDILLTIMEGKGLDIYPVMQRIANIEHTINKSLEEGKIDYLTTNNINSIKAYKLPMSSKYMHYDLWINVFQDKYGSIGTPPYRGVKLSTTLNNKRIFKQWLTELGNETANGLVNWMNNNNKKELGVLILPYELFETGLPIEFTFIIDKRKIITELMAGYYILLEMCGFYIKNKKGGQLLSDDLPFKII